jgi:hypothetical protein
MRKGVDKRFTTWHVVYTLLLSALGFCLMLGETDECVGPWLGYWFLAFGALPSLLMLVVGLRWPVVAYVMAVVWGALVVVAALVAGTDDGWGLLTFIPLLGFTLEAAAIAWSRPHA